MIKKAIKFLTNNKFKGFEPPPNFTSEMLE